MNWFWEVMGEGFFWTLLILTLALLGLIVFVVIKAIGWISLLVPIVIFVVGLIVTSCSSCVKLYRRSL